MIKEREKGEGATEQHTDLIPIRVNARLAAPLLLLLFAALAVSSHAASNTILTVVGLPAGAQIPVRFAPNYTTVTYTATNYTTAIPIYISASTNTTYHGAVPYQWQGAGTTVTYNGVTYTMLGSTYTQIINVGKNNVLGFYVYLNASLWNTNEKAELAQVNASLSTTKMVVQAIKNSSITLPYNGTASAGTTSKYATYSNGTVNFVAANIVKATPPLVLTVDGHSITQAGSYTIPIAIINGKVGLSGKTYYWLNGSVTSALVAGNQQSYNYSIRLSNGTVLIPPQVTTGSGITKTFSYKISEYVSANVTIDLGGNANYTPLDPSGITLPSNVLTWVNTSIDNTQSSVLTANTQIAFEFDAGALRASEAANMMNVEFFNTSTGIVQNCWLEGNVLNEQQTSNLYTSNTLLYWCKYPQQIGATTTVTNAIAVGFGNTLTDFFGSTTGTAPQLSAKYGTTDNGKNVFQLYENFTGTSTPTGWTKSGIAWIISNGLTSTIGAGTSQLYTTATTYGSNAMQIIDTYGTVPSTGGTISDGWLIAGFVAGGTVNTGIGLVMDGVSSPAPPYLGTANPSAAAISVATSTTAVFTANYPAAGFEGFSQNYGAFSTLTGNPFGGSTESVGFSDQGGAHTSGPFYWIRMRLAPPNNVQPTITYSNGGTFSYYSASGTTKTNPIITGSAEEWFLNFSNPYAGGTITNAVLILGNQTLTLGTVLANKYYYNLNSFVPSRFGIANPTGINSSSVPYMMNAIVTFNGNTVLRNATGSFTVNAPALLTCAAYTANAFAWNFYNATSLLPIDENVLMSGYFTIKNGLYSSNTIQGTSAGFSLAATSNTYQTCMFPPWSTFGTYGTFQYAANNYSGSQFLMVNQSTSNVVKPINLYLQQIDNPSAYDIVVESGINNPISAYVQELLYNINLNESVLVNEFQTPVGGGYVVNLQTNSYYQFKVFNSNGQLLNTTSYLQASCASGSVCTYYIQTANISITTPTQYLGNLAFTCASTPNIPANTILESCSVSSLNGASINATLSLWKSLPLQNMLNCTQSLNAASFNLACTAHQVNNHTYVWQLIYHAPYGSQILKNGNLGTNPPLFGNMGILVAIIIVAAMGLVFISVNPGVAIILAVAGMIISGLLALITLNVDAMGFLIVFLAIVVFALRGRG